MAAPRISLIIPAWNEQAYLPRLLDTVDEARRRYNGAAEAVEVIAHFSPNGKYILFTRRAGFQTEEPSKVYWVSAEILKALKP